MELEMVDLKVNRTELEKGELMVAKKAVCSGEKTVAWTAVHLAAVLECV